MIGRWFYPVLGSGRWWRHHLVPTLSRDRQPTGVGCGSAEHCWPFDACVCWPSETPSAPFAPPVKPPRPLTCKILMSLIFSIGQTPNTTPATHWKCPVCNRIRLIRQICPNPQTSQSKAIRRLSSRSRWHKSLNPPIFRWYVRTVKKGRLKTLLIFP